MVLDNRMVRLGVALGFFVLFGLGAAGGLNQAFQEQPDLKWLHIGLAFLAFASGFIVVKIQINHLHLNLETEINREEKVIGRSLSELEIQEVKARFKESHQQGEANIRFPLQRLVVRLLLLLPAIIAVGLLVAIGAFISGACFAAFIEDSQKRTLADF